MISLQSDALLVRVDPLHGGEILDLVDCATGRQLLGHPPFPSLAPLAGELDEDAWTDRYRGGWQAVTPNAGNACVHGGEQHGFHGRASNDPWDVVERTVDAVALRWSGHGLDITRSLVLDGGSLVVETEWEATRDEAAFVTVEHIVLGHELLAPTAKVRLPGGIAFEFSEVDGPVRAPLAATTWPDVVLQDGGLERGDVVSLAEPNARLLAVQDLPEGWYEVVNCVTGQGVRVDWELATLPHLWLWREVRTAGERWRGQAELLGMEPASVPHSLGLARALAEGQAIVLDRGGRRRSSVTMTPIRPT